MRGQVNELCCRYAAEDREILQRLLGTINGIYHLHVSGSNDRMERESAKEQGLKARAAADPTLHGNSNRFSFDSRATIAIGGLPTAQTNESEDGFGRESSLLTSEAFFLDVLTRAIYGQKFRSRGNDL